MKPQFSSIYRLQFTEKFNFQDALRLLPYLHKLGVEGIYACPIYKIVRGSKNQYMIVSPSQINKSLGSDEDFKQFVEEIYNKEMHLILDVVPNHLAAHEDNLYFSNVLKNGQTSSYAKFFDIAFQSVSDRNRQQKIILPILPKSLSACINEKIIELKVVEGHHFLKVGDRFLPCNYKEGLSLQELIHSQYYLLCEWRESLQKMNYRRFFDINELIGINIEEEELYQLVHALPLELKANDKISGLRIDHPDGIKHLESYLRKLRGHFPQSYIWLEKILQMDEKIPKQFPVDGCVGYEYLNRLNALFIMQNAFAKLKSIYSLFEEHKDLVLEIHKCKKLVIKKFIFGEVSRIITKIYEVLKRETPTLETDLRAFKSTFINFLSFLDVYRTYLDQERGAITPYYRSKVEVALSRVKKYYPKASKISLKMIEGLFIEKPINSAILDLILELQQYMPCIFAKGYEDTFLYRYFLLTSMNEVGSNLIDFGLSSSLFHEYNQWVLNFYPHTLITTTTHDTKRSEDTRSRITAISHAPDKWNKFIQDIEKVLETNTLETWSKVSSKIRYFFYQTIIGVYQCSDKESLILRLKHYMTKALREGKEFSSWVQPDSENENNLMDFIDSVFTNNEALHLIEDFVATIAPIGEMISLSSLNIKLVSPGIYDLYQGQELFQFHLVDPDNRQEVNYSLRKQELSSKNISPKFDMIQRGLKFRRHYKELFLYGDYVPIYIQDLPLDLVWAVIRKNKHHKILAVSRLNFSDEIPDEVFIPIEGVDIGKDVYSDTEILVENSKIKLKSLFKVNPYALVFFA